MTTNENALSHRNFGFNTGDDFFTIDGEHKRFEDVTALYLTHSSHFSVRVFKEVRLCLMLLFSDAQSIEEYEAGSSDKESYRLLFLIAEGLVLFRKEKLSGSYERGENISFAIRDERDLIYMKNSRVFIGDKEVQSLIMGIDDQCPSTEFVMDDGSLVLADERISDNFLFFELAIDLYQDVEGYKGDEWKQPKWKLYLYRAFYTIVVLFGINGLVGFNSSYALFIDYTAVMALSTIAGMSLGLMLLCYPFFWAINWQNERKMAKLAAYLEEGGK